MGSHGARHLRILVVDDSPAVRARLTDLLVKQGVRPAYIQAIEDPAHVIAATETHDPDLVFFDVSSDLGAQFAVALLGYKPRIPVIAMGAVEPGDGPVRRVVDYGAYDILPKPLRPDGLAEVMERFTEEAGSSTRIAADRW